MAARVKKELSVDKLKELIMKGPDRRYRVKAEVLARFDDISAARALMRTWPDITEALGFERGRWKQVSACFGRVSKNVASGKLKIGKLMAGFSSGRNESAQQKPASKSGIIDLDDPANQ